MGLDLGSFNMMWGKYMYFKGLLFLLGRLFAGMQRIVQYNMKKMYAELKATGESATLPKVVTLLKKNENLITAGHKFLGDQAKSGAAQGAVPCPTEVLLSLYSGGCRHNPFHL